MESYISLWTIKVSNLKKMQLYKIWFAFVFYFSFPKWVYPINLPPFPSLSTSSLSHTSIHNVSRGIYEDIHRKETRSHWELHTIIRNWCCHRSSIFHSEEGRRRHSLVREESGWDGCGRLGVCSTRTPGQHVEWSAVEWPSGEFRVASEG
jgi:hypothetical protein